MREYLNLPKDPVCKRCGKPIEKPRAEMGFDICMKCSRELTTPYRMKDHSASSLHWI